MLGILILAHGSRQNNTEKTMETIANYVREELDIKLIEAAYMQFRDINLEKGLEKLVEQGADEIKLIPYFLFDGVHIKEDIPEEIAQFTQKHPNIKVTMGKTLGADKRLALIVADRIREAVG